MALDDLVKPSGGVGLQRYWKDLFPDRTTTLYVYKGVNQLHRGRNVFSREDDISIISLEKIDEVKGIFGGEALTTGPLTIEENKNIKELELNNIPSQGFTAFLEDLKHDYKDQNLYFTLGQEFIEKDVNNENFDVYVAVGTNPNIFAKSLQGLVNVDDSMKADFNKTTIAWTLSPAVLQNNLQASKVAFADAKTYNPLPRDKKDFEITSIEIQSDQSFMPEYGNWVKGKGIVETNGGQLIEEDIDFKADKELLPIGIAPYAKNGNVQFAIKNFNKHTRMPWFFAKQFLTTDRKLSTYILQGSTETWAKALSTAIVDMFIMSWAFSTGFLAYRDADGVIKNQKIGGVAIKNLENKDAKDAVDQVLKNWEYANPLKTKTSEFLRAKQVLAASSQWIKSSYCISGGLTEVHKTLFDFYLDLDSSIAEGTQDINMNLGSLRYTFDETNPAAPKIKALIPRDNQSTVNVDSLDRYVSAPELDDPISIENLFTFPGDIDSTKADSLKYMVGVDITDPTQIEKFLIDSDVASEKVVTKRVAIDTTWNIFESSAQEDYIIKNFFVGKVVDGIKVETIIRMVNSNERIEEVILRSKQIPSSATKIKIIDSGNRITSTMKNFYVANIERWEGAVVEYDIKVIDHGVEGQRYTYDKGIFIKNILNYTDNSLFKRTLTLSDEFKDENGIYTVKMKEINRLWFSFFLGNYLDIKINYKHDDGSGNVVTGTTRIPRLTLPSVHDERRTKFGVRI